MSSQHKGTTESGKDRKATFLTGGCACAVVAAALWSLLGNFLPINEGWFNYYGHLMNQGKVPYRDFYFFTQPLSLWISQFITGRTDLLIAFRWYGFWERIVITALLFYLLRRFFSNKASFWATIISSLVYVNYATDAYFSYLNTCLLFVLLASVFVVKALQTGGPCLWLWAFSGAAAGGAFLAKQSNGLIAVAAVLFTVFFLPLKWNGKQVAAVFGGIFVSVLPLLYYLYSHQIQEAYWNQVFVGASESKGGLILILFGFFQRFLPTAPFLIVAMVAGYSIYRKGWLAQRTTSPEFKGRKEILWISLGLIGLTVVPFAEISPDLARYVLFPPVHVLLQQTVLVILTFVSLTAVAVTVDHLIRWQKKAERPSGAMASVLVMASAWIYSCGMSYQIEEQAAIPGFALFIAFLLDRIKLGAPEHDSRAVPNYLIIACTILIFVCASAKRAVPFRWVGWSDTALGERKPSREPGLKGYTINSKTVEMYDEILKLVREERRPGDTMFTFPCMPMFNYLTGCPQPTFAVVHYWDVCPDPVAKKDAALIAAYPPRFLIEMEMIEEHWKEQENGFRGGRKSGQRVMHETLALMASSGEYKLAYEGFTAGWNFPVRVWVRTIRN